MTALLIALMGLVGVMLRYGVNQLWRMAGLLPSWNTFVINTIGSFAIGYFFQMQRSGRLPEIFSVALMVGLLGGFTTFSGYSLDTFKLLDEVKWGQAALYFVISPFLCLCATYIGIKAAS